MKILGYATYKRRKVYILATDYDLAYIINRKGEGAWVKISDLRNCTLYSHFVEIE